jgi:predicted NBD/HSP70 family sugar kinase
MIAIGIDVGGTRTRVAAVDRSGRVLARRHHLADRTPDGNALIDWLDRAVAEVFGEARPHDAEIGGVGLALPGIIDRQGRVVVRSVNLPFLEGRPIAEELGGRTGLEVRLVTDADAATWAEYLACSPSPRGFVHLRLGTGIACGVVTDGSLLDLSVGRSGHLDALIVDDRPDAATCRCGKRGCLETAASGVALTERGQQAGFQNGLPDLRRGWERQDQAAMKIIQHAAAGLSLALGNLGRRFGPEVISVGGGVASQLPVLLETALEHFRVSGAPNACGLRASIQQSCLGDDAGAIGAALLAMRAA